jgi:exosortase/archaeosortase family protein
MSALGWRTYWRLFPTLALTFLMIPSGDILQPVLRDLTVKCIELFAAVAHLPYRIDGFVVHIGEHRYVVVDACSGLPNVILGTFLGYCFGLMLYRSMLRIAALALFGAFVGILSNVLRVNAILLIDWARGSQMDLAAHGSIQWIALFVTLASLFYALNRLRAEATPAAAPVPVATERATTVGRLAPVAAGLSVLLIVGGVDRLTTDASQSPRGAGPEALPQDMLGWRLITPAPGWNVDHANHSEFLTLTYRRNGRDIRVVIVEPLSPNAKLTESRLAPGSGDWRENRVEKRVSCVETSCLTLVHKTWLHGKSNELRHAYYAFAIGGHTTESKLQLRALHGWHRLIGSGSNPRLIGLVVDNAPLAVDEAAAAFRMLRATFDAAGPASRHVVTHSRPSSTL